jgi:hypothetical protein
MGYRGLIVVTFGDYFDLGGEQSRLVATQISRKTSEIWGTRGPLAIGMARPRSIRMAKPHSIV